MSPLPQLLPQLSEALSAHADRARAYVAAIRGRRRSLSAVLWQGDVLVSSAQSLRVRDSYEVVAATGSSQEATLIGIDPSTNIVALRLSAALPSQALRSGVPSLGALALAYGVDPFGNLTARLGSVSVSGGAWHSSRGGYIDQSIVLDIRLERFEEGGPIFAADGSFIGMSTFGAARRVMAIPAATIERIVPMLLQDGQVARGWLGLALQPVAVPEAFRGEGVQTAALMAMSIAAQGPAAKAGIVAGDIVLSIDGDSTQRFRNILSRLGSDSIDRQVELRIIRKGMVEAVKLTVEQRPSA